MAASSCVICGKPFEDWQRRHPVFDADSDRAGEAHSVCAGVREPRIGSAPEPHLCVTGSCLAHRKRVFQQSGGPDAGRWCHLDGWPCEAVSVRVAGV